MSRKRWLDVAGGVCAAIVPLAVGLARGGDGIEASCDAAVVRVVGRGYTGGLHGLDAMLGAPLGAHAHFATLGCAVGLGVVAYVLARRLTRTTVPDAFGVVLAVIAAALATLTFPAQRESMLVGGSVLGAVLVLGPVLLASVGARSAFVAGAVGLAATYDAPTGVAAAAACAAVWLASGAKRSWSALAAALVGVVPVAWMLLRRDAAPDASLDAPFFSGWLGEGGRAAPRAVAWTVARSELGVVALAAAAYGAVLALRSRVARPIGAALASVVVAGVAASALGAPAGPDRFGAALLAALAATSVLAAMGMGAVVLAVANARVPLARASAAMIVLLELAIPARVADDASLAIRKLGPGETHRWNARVFGGLPHDAVLVVTTSRMLLRARAAATTGELRGDVLVVARSGVSGRAIGRLIAREPLLAPVVRDLALYGAPEEFSLSELATARPLFVAFDASMSGWDTRFARHLLPQGAFDRYFVEPRGGAERMKAFATCALDESVARAIAADPALRDATRDILVSRALAGAAAGERDYARAATVELERVAPADPLTRDLARRIATTHGAVDLAELAQRSRD